MGYTILFQWSYSGPNRTVPLNEYILTRILEHYNLSQHVRSTVQLRTFRAAFPTADSGASGSSSSTRLLTNIAYSQPVPPVRDASAASIPRDDTTYVVIEDRSVPQTGGSDTTAPAISRDAQAQEGVAGSSKPPSQAPTPVPPTGGTPVSTAVPAMEDDFEIIDPPPDTSIPASTPDGPPVPRPSEALPSVSAPRPDQKRRFRTLAVRPAASVLPLLTNLLSPFVMGFTKSARAAASTTAEMPRPTPLPGTALLLTSFTFPIPTPPHPPVILTIHNLPTATPTSIFLEAELDGEFPDEDKGEEEGQGVLKAFLEGCLPEGVDGTRKYIVWDADAEQTSWDGVERVRKVSQMLAKTLREGGFA